MKSRKFFMGIILGLGIVGVVVGGYYWNRQTLHHAKVIYQPVEEKEREEENEQKREQNKEELDKLPLTETEGRLNILVLGVDNHGEEPGRSDSIILVSANMDSHQVSVISIPRDTRVSLPGVGLTKITHANAVGELKGGVPEGSMESVKAVSDLLGVNTNFYIKVNFKGFQKAVDALGGIDVSLPVTVKDTSSDLYLAAGEHHLSGEEALKLAQARYDLPRGDFDRQQNQFYILQGLANQLLNPSTISELPELLSVMREDIVDSNMSISEMIIMGLEFKGIDKEAIKYFQLPGEGISAPDPLVGANVYYYEPNKDGIKQVVEEALAK